MNTPASRTTPRRFGPTLALVVTLLTIATGPVTAQSDYETIYASDTMFMDDPIASPDGRWLAFTGATETDRWNVYVLPMGGDEPIQLTRGNFTDGRAVWSPDSRSLYFTSDRVEGQASSIFHVMRIPFDPETGQASGLPRPISLEENFGQGPAVSPDGSRVAFLSRAPDTDTPRLLVVPAEGGAAVEVMRDDDLRAPLAWSADSRWLYARRQAAEANLTDALLRVSADGGSPEVVASGIGRLRAVSADGSSFLWGPRGGPTGTELVVSDASGDVRGRVELSSDAVGGELSPDGASVFATEGLLRSRVAISPIDGGESIELGDPDAYSWPMTWTDDGRLFFTSDRRTPAGEVDEAYLGDPRTGAVTPLEGYASSVGTLGVNSRLHPDGRHELYSRHDSPDDPTVTLVLRDLQTGTERVLSESVPAYPRGGGTELVTGRGGTPMLDENRFMFLERGDSGLLIRTVVPGRPVETLMDLERATAEAPTERPAIAVHGRRVAWVESDDDSRSTLMVADAETGRVDAVLTSEATVADPRWSRDGTRIALMYIPDDAVDYDLAVVDLSANTPALDVHDAGAKWWWSHQWTEGDDQIAVVGMAASATEDTDVWIIDARNGTPPAPVIGSNDVWTWGVVVSPDGRWLAYHLEELGSNELRRYSILPAEGAPER